MDNEEENPPSSGVGGGQSLTSASQSGILVSSPNYSSRRKRSNMWNYWTVKRNENGENRVYCNKCPTSYSWSRNSGTTNLKRHYEKCFESSDVGRKLVKFDDKVAREKYSRVIIRHNLPFLSVEYEELRDYFTYLNPDYQCYTRNTAVADVLKTSEKEKQKLKSELQNIPSRICLTSDCWTVELSGVGYIVLTAHYIDSKWVLNSKILSFCDMPPPHTGEALASKLHEILKEWGIEKKVFTLTLDNATSNNCMQDILRDRLNLDDNLLLKGEFFHVRCCAHILNLIVQDGLAVISSSLSKIRATVKYVKGSRTRRIALAECVEEDGEIVMSLDVQHRWNSTYLMLEKALKYEQALNRFKSVDKNYKYCPSSVEWNRAKVVNEILMPFYSITKLMSGRNYSTSNIYFGHIWKIQCLLEVYKYHEDSDIRKMIDQMRVKFDKYWEQYSVILAMGVVFDPRMKLRLMRRCYSELNPHTSDEKILHLKSELTKLFDEYKKVYPPTPTVSSTRTWSRASERARANLGVQDDLFDLDEIPDDMEEEKSALTIYLEEQKLEMKVHPNLDVLQYWKDNGHRYGALAYMARDVLSIPVTTVASESSFSIGSHVINKYRNRLIPSNVEALLCTRSWIHGYTVDEEDDGEIVIIRQDPNLVEEHSMENHS